MHVMEYKSINDLLGEGYSFKTKKYCSAGKKEVVVDMARPEADICKVVMEV